MSLTDTELRESKMTTKKAKMKQAKYQ